MAKKHLGFETPAQALLNEYEEVLKLLIGQEVSWLDMQEVWVDALREMFPHFQDVMKLDGSGDIKISVAQTMNTAMLLALVSRIGLELTYTHKRLAKVESSVKALKKSMK